MRFITILVAPFESEFICHCAAQHILTQDMAFNAIFFTYCLWHMWLGT